MKITPLIDTLRLQKIDDDEYFSERYKNYLSNSRLNLIDPNKDGSFDKFVAGFKPIYSAAFDLGSGIHMMSLQSDLFTICDTVDKPTAKMGALADRLYRIHKGETPSKDSIIEQATIVDYYGGNLSDTKISKILSDCLPYWTSRRAFEDSYTGDKEILYFDPKSRQIVYNCVEALSNNQRVQKLLHPKGLLEDPISECEQAILLDVLVESDKGNKFIIKLKSKLDNYTIDKESGIIRVNDIKSIGKIVSEMPNNIQKFRYNREIAMYSWLLSLCAKKYYGLNNPIVEGNYLVVSTIPGHYTKVIPMTRAMYREGWEEFVKLLRLVAKGIEETHSDFGVWI